MTALLDTWSSDASQEDCMTDEHLWIWREMIAAAPLPRGSDSRVLDFGCNQGGFLRVLHDTTPIAEGVGVDLAQDAIQKAEADKGARPLRYLATPTVSDAGRDFDIAFSHEVIYLIPDLAEHARQISTVLRPGASYYAVTCCHADNPRWHIWRDKIAAFSKIPVPNHSITDVVTAFLDTGFEVSAACFLANAQIPLEGPTDYFPSAVDRIEIYSRWKTLFRCTWQG
ncbi:MAG: class I SAM-dependent methyltransferase [Pseudomonadota bacterium]